MIWLENVRGNVFKVEVQEKVVKASLSTSEKKQDGTYENSSWFVAFVGNCKDKASSLQDKDRITISKAKVSNVYNKEHKKSYLNFTIFDFEVEGRAQQQSQPTQNNEQQNSPQLDDPLPF